MDNGEVSQTLMTCTRTFATDFSLHQTTRLCPRVTCSKLSDIDKEQIIKLIHTQKQHFFRILEKTNKTPPPR